MVQLDRLRFAMGGLHSQSRAYYWGEGGLDTCPFLRHTLSTLKARLFDKGPTESGVGAGFGHELIVVDTGQRLGCCCGEGLVSSRFGGFDLAILEHLLLLHRAERGKAVAPLAGLAAPSGARARDAAARRVRARARARGARLVALGTHLRAV